MLACKRDMERGKTTRSGERHTYRDGSRRRGLRLGALRLVVTPFPAAEALYLGALGRRLVALGTLVPLFTTLFAFSTFSALRTVTTFAFLTLATPIGADGATGYQWLLQGR